MVIGIVQAAQKFGLGSKTGIEINEISMVYRMKIEKKKSTLHYLEIKLNEILKDYISDELYTSENKSNYRLYIEYWNEESFHK